MYDNNLELLDYAYQGPEIYCRITKGGNNFRGALINSLKIINTLYNVQYIATLNGHTILNEIIPRTEQPGFYYGN